MVHLWVLDGRDGLQIWRIVANNQISSHGRLKRGSLWLRDWVGDQQLPAVKSSLLCNFTVSWTSMGSLDSTSSGQGPMAGSCEHGNESSDSIKHGEFFH
jgi:hypothetical protein